MGNWTHAALREAQELSSTATLPMEDARTLLLTRRDITLSDRLREQDAFWQPYRNASSSLGDAIRHSKDNIGFALNQTLLRPVNATAGLVTRFQNRLSNQPGTSSLLLACLLNPSCCTAPDKCPP